MKKSTTLSEMASQEKLFDTLVVSSVEITHTPSPFGGQKSLTAGVQIFFMKKVGFFFKLCLDGRLGSKTRGSKGEGVRVTYFWEG